MIRLHQSKTLQINCLLSLIACIHKSNINDDPYSKVHGGNMGPSGADRTQVGPMEATWTLLSGNSMLPLNTKRSKELLRLRHTFYQEHEIYDNYGAICCLGYHATVILTCTDFNHSHKGKLEVHSSAQSSNPIRVIELAPDNWIVLIELSDQFPCNEWRLNQVHCSLRVLLKHAPTSASSAMTPSFRRSLIYFSYISILCL